MKRSGFAYRPGRMVQLGLLERLRPTSAERGPISDLTGGPLNASEAMRVMLGRSIRVTGLIWGQTGRVVCRRCFDRMITNSPVRGEGYSQPLYESTDRRGYCFACGGPVCGIEGP